jgi:hypothetical protein
MLRKAKAPAKVLADQGRGEGTMTFSAQKDNSNRRRLQGWCRVLDAVATA